MAIHTGKHNYCTYTVGNSRCIPDDMFLEVRLGVVENMLHKTIQKEGQGQQHEETGHEPGSSLGVAVLGAEVVGEEREGHHQESQVEGCHGWLAPAPPPIPARPLHAATPIRQCPDSMFHGQSESDFSINQYSIIKELNSFPREIKNATWLI